MNKKELIQAINAQLVKDLDGILAEAKSTLDAATNEESKAENQYDTRALEAGYLAGAQAKRVNELRDVIGLFQTIHFKELSANDPVQATALVEVLLDGKKNTLLMMPKGGGVRVDHAGESILLVTPSSHLGEAILGLRAGESTEFEIGEKTKACKIISVR